MKRDWCSCDGSGRAGTVTSRRALLAGAATAGVWWLGTRSALAQATIRKGGSDGNVLVVVFLRGGADGLNMVAPYGEDDYYRHRPSLGLKSPSSGVAAGKKLIDLDGFFGLNPGLAAFEGLYKEGSLAVIHAVGSGDVTHSHFEAMNTMERGWKNQQDTAGGGWLARHLNMTEGSGSPLRGVSIAPVLPDSLLGAVEAQAMVNVSEFRLNTQDEAMKAALGRLYANPGDDIARAGHDTLAVLKSLNGVDPRTYQSDGGANYPQTPVGEALSQVAFLIKRDIGLEVACIDAGGWDTHVTQGSTDGWMYGLLEDLSRSVAALMTDLGSLAQKTTVLIQTEFGRRVAENSGLGTDHGTGGCMFVLGAGVNGGKVYADWPGLVPDQLAGPGDLQTTTDYRAVLTDLLLRRLGNPDPRKVFPGYSGGGLGVVG